MNRTLAGSLLAGLVVFGSPAANATVLSLASEYNIYVLGNMNQTSDSEGRVAVAGNATLSNYGVGDRLPAGTTGNSLVVGGNLTYNGGQVFHGSTVYGGTLTGNFGSPNGTVSQGTGLDFAAASSYLTTASNYWGGLGSNGQTVEYYGGVRLIGTQSDLNVFTVSGDYLSKSWGVNIDAPAGSTVLINVTGDSSAFRNLGFSFEDLNGDGKGTVSRQNVIYNFVDATSLTINGAGIQGSVLAPKANVQFDNGNINGQLIAGNLSGSGEAHNYLFQGSLPTPVQVPEPSSSLLVIAAGGLLAMRRRR